MLILGIETSCDETAAAVVENGTKIISNIIASSQSLHAKYGGIIPDKAAREQLKAIIPTIKEAFIPSEVEGSRLDPSEIDAIGVTIGPGLIGSLLVGVETAKSLSLAWDKPLIPVNHLIGHIYANFILSEVEGSRSPKFPALVLIVSGGHSELVLMKNHGEFQYLGGTRDDAAGECFDKCARLLGLGYPGGPAIEKAAVAGKVKLPRPMINNDNLDFSFSGLKTALARRSLGEGGPALAYELQEAVTDVLVAKTLKAAKDFKVGSILLAGGVAANKRLREKMSEAVEKLDAKVDLFIPPFSLCTDNAACIASAAYFNNQPVTPTEVNAGPDFGIDE